MEGNDIVHATQRSVYGYVDTRAVWGSQTESWEYVVWIAVSCCCGLEGPMEKVQLPSPKPYRKLS